MPVQLKDAEIVQLLAERKVLPADYREQMQMKPKRGHRERELDVIGDGGNEFRLILRESLFDSLDFSVILAYRPPQSNQLFRLRRYNGRSHEHTNTLEGQTFYEFHIHTATERYQESGLREDTFGEPTDRFGSFQEAIRCMLKDCGFDVPSGVQGTLFGEDF